MPKKKKRKIQFRKPYHTLIVHPKLGILPLEEYPTENLPAYKPKPTLHAKGGLIKGKPKLAKRGF